MDYFLANPKPKPLSKEELLELYLESEARAKENTKNQQTHGCGCCSAENTKK